MSFKVPADFPSRPVAVIGAGSPDGERRSSTPVAIASAPHRNFHRVSGVMVIASTPALRPVFPKLRHF